MISREGILVCALVLSALAVITVRHQDRVLFSRWAVLQSDGDRLNVEWSKLLLEEGAFAAHQRIGQIARRDLDMTMPSRAQTVILYTTPQPGPPAP